MSGCGHAPPYFEDPPDTFVGVVAAFFDDAEMAFFDDTELGGTS